MNRLPEPPARQPHATQAGQPTPTDTDREQAARWLAALDQLPTTQPTAVHVDDPTIPSWKDGPRIGNTPPVTDQPGARRPAMSQRATDASALMLSAGIASIPIGGMASLFVYTLGHVDPTALAIAAAAPATIALPILALCRFAIRAKAVIEAAPPVINQTYNGTVHQDARTLTTTSRGIIATTRNELPR